MTITLCVQRVYARILNFLRVTTPDASVHELTHTHTHIEYYDLRRRESFELHAETIRTTLFIHTCINVCFMLTPFHDSFERIYERKAAHRHIKNGQNYSELITQQLFMHRARDWNF